MNAYIEELIDRHYPKARTCSHADTAESFEREIADDRYDYVIVSRCTNCNWPVDSRYASEEEIAAHNEPYTRI